MIWYPLQIRFRDLDPLAHVNNAVYFVYFEEARSYYFKHLESWLTVWPSEEEHQVVIEGTPSEIEHTASRNPRIQTTSQGRYYGFLVKETTCTYELPLVRSDTVEIGVRVIKVGRTSFVMEHQICDATNHERIFATGRSVMVWCDYRSGRPYPLPPTLRHAFEQLEQRDFPPAVTKATE